MLNCHQNGGDRNGECDTRASRDHTSERRTMISKLFDKEIKCSLCYSNVPESMIVERNGGLRCPICIAEGDMNPRYRNQCDCGKSFLVEEDVTVSKKVTRRSTICPDCLVREQS